GANARDGVGDERRRSVAASIVAVVGTGTKTAGSPPSTPPKEGRAGGLAEWAYLASVNLYGLVLGRISVPNVIPFGLSVTVVGTRRSHHDSGPVNRVNRPYTTWERGNEGVVVQIPPRVAWVSSGQVNYSVHRNRVALLAVASRLPTLVTCCVSCRSPLVKRTEGLDLLQPIVVEGELVVIRHPVRGEFRAVVEVQVREAWLVAFCQQ